MRRDIRPSRRKFVALTGGCATAALLAACAPGAAEGASSPSVQATKGFDTTKPVTITVSDGWGTEGTGKLFGDVISGFEKKYPNVKIVRDTTDYDSYAQSIILKGSSATPPDVMMLETAGYGQGFYQFARSGRLLALDDYAKAYGWADRFGADSNLDVFRFDHAKGDQWGTGPLFGLPEQNSMVAVFYNADLLKKAGVNAPPKTWDEFEKSLASAKAAGITPIAQHNSYIHTYMAVWNALAADAKEVNDWTFGRGGSFANPSSQRAAQAIAEWQAKGYFQPGVSGASYGDASGTFLNGKALYYIEGSWMAGAVEGSLKSKGGVFQLPTSTGSAAPAGGGLTTPLAISSKSAHPDVAAAFLDYFTSQEVSDQLAAGGWGLPGAKTSDSVAQGADLTSKVLSMLRPIEAQGGAGTTPFLDWSAPTLGEQLPANLQKMAAGDMTPADFTSTIQGISTKFTSERSGG